ncbi:transketolase family protein [Patescibacteria group bacterium]|nr:transketolase family protein [Patescibacteria group bacterium]
MPTLLHPDLFTERQQSVATRNGYGDALLELGAADERIVVLTADLAESTRVHGFREQFPERFIECGVSEQHMVGMAAGLALSGKIPFLSSYAVFMPGRSWDQVRVSVCYTQANVKLVGAHAGLSVGPDGATHQALEDIAITRVLPNLTVIVPCDYHEAKAATVAMAGIDGPMYLRLTREPTPVILAEDTPFTIGKHRVLRPGADVTLVACGPLVYEALEAAELLEKKGLSAEVINASTIKPFDEKTLLASVKKTGCVVTVEEHQVHGGLFGAVSEILAQHLPTPIEAIAMPDSFGESGEPKELLHAYGLTTADIVKAAKRAVSRKH